MKQSLNLNWAAGSLAVMVGLPMVFDPLGANGAHGQTVRFQTGTVETTTVTTTTIQVGPDSTGQRPAVVYRESVTTPNVIYAQPGYAYGGVYNSGVYNGGVYNGGVYSSGVYNGGVYNSGVYSGGVYSGGHHPGRTDRDDRFRGPVIVVPVYPPIIQYRTVTIPLESTLNPPACAPPSDGKLRPSFSLSGC
jgi:hypothetical protein